LINKAKYYYRDYFQIFNFSLLTVNMDDIDSIEDTTEKILMPQEEYQETLIFNNTIREIFLNRFVQMFSSYEHFVIQPSQVQAYYASTKLESALVIIIKL